MNILYFVKYIINWLKIDVHLVPSLDTYCINLLGNLSFLDIHIICLNIVIHKTILGVFWE